MNEPTPQTMPVRAAVLDPRRRAFLTRLCVVPQAGLASLSRQQFRNAYEAFTEAIRLSPQKVRDPVLAVYLAGSELTAPPTGGVPLQPCSCRVATRQHGGRRRRRRGGDQTEPAARGGTYARGQSAPCAKAAAGASLAVLTTCSVTRFSLAQRASQQALQHYKHVLTLNPAHDAAVRGMCVARTQNRPQQQLTLHRAISAEATALADQQHTDAARAAAAATRGDRPPLPQQRLVSAESAAEQLLTAEAMLRAHPAMDDVICAHIEALIMCRKYDAALKACTTSLVSRSLDALYLRAEAQWRSGNPDGAMETLDAAGIDENAKCKCGLLASFLKQLLVRLDRRRAHHARA